MPYDKNGNYYRKPVYRVEKIKKDFPLKKKRHIRFYTLGLIAPYVFIFFSLLITYLCLYLIGLLAQISIPDRIALAIIFFLLFIPSLIALVLIFYRRHKSQVKNYLKQGGKLTKKKIFILAILWWILSAIFISLPLIVMICFFALIVGVITAISSIFTGEIILEQPKFCEPVMDKLVEWEERQLNK